MGEGTTTLQREIALEKNHYYILKNATLLVWVYISVYSKTFNLTFKYLTFKTVELHE